MADVLIGFVVQELASFLLDHLKEEVGLVAGARGEVKKITDTFKKIQAVLNDAESKQVKDDAVKLWLEELKDAAYEIEDVLDEWKTRILISQLDGGDDAVGSSTNKKKISAYFSSLCSCFTEANEKVMLHHEVGHKIKELREKLDTIAKDKDTFKLDPTIMRIEEPIVRVDTSSLIDCSIICGRDEDKKCIIEKLLSESSNDEADVPVISIKGIGGLGKTALAQLIFNDDMVTRHFEKKVWVCVSDPFDKKKIAAIIIGALGDAAPAAATWEALQQQLCKSLIAAPAAVTWEALQQQLCKSLTGKKILLVFDDVWTQDSETWRQIKIALDKCAEGSRVVVTTRHEVVSITVGSSYTHDLRILNDDNCWLLFSHYAFHGKGVDDCANLESIGRQISDKCKGIPLFARTLGSLMLRKKNVEQWEHILQSDLWHVQEVNEDILPVLLLSYNALPPHLKRCFTYCVVYEKGWRYHKDVMVQHWISQGFILPSHLKDMEILGGEYFDDLVSRSFFHDLKTDKDDNDSYAIHDLLHDFANLVSNNECSVVESVDTELEHAKTRHIRFHYGEKHLILSFICKVNSLRTLIMSTSETKYDLDINLFNHLKCLRTLNLSEVAIESLPNEIGNLIHLRYLDLSQTRLVELPETISKLRNLQTLKLNSCEHLCRLPKGLGKLLSLRHLELRFSRNLEGLPRGLGGLKHLHTMNKFIVSEGECQFRELGDLNNLHGLLAITKIKGVSENAGEAKLKSKKHLRHVDLQFVKEAYEGKDIHDATVLELLQPPSSLVELDIFNYSGSKFPTWMESPMVISKLLIYDCENLEALPSFGKLGSLLYLNLGGLDSIVSATSLFAGLEASTTIAYPKLKTLIIREMKHWEKWEMESVGVTTTIMPSLHYLAIHNCPKLKSLPRQILSGSVTEICISACPKLTISYLPPLLQELDLFEDAGSLSTSLPFHHNTTLTKLTIAESPHSSLPKGISELKALQTLTISDCNSLTSIVEDLQSHTSLELLRIWDCPILEGDWSILSHIPEIWIDDERIN